MRTKHDTLCQVLRKYDKITFMKRSKSSRRWLEEHFSDSYVKKAQQAGLRSRASFKLTDLDDKYKLFKPGMWVIDLGAAPGGWSQILSPRLGEKGKIIAVDILDMPSIAQVCFIKGDMLEESTWETIRQCLNNQKVDWIVSDMAPNLSGNKIVDQAKSIALIESAFEVVETFLKPQGGFLIKAFQGTGFDDYLKRLRTHFDNVLITKPKSSRERSREVYLLATGYTK